MTDTVSPTCSPAWAHAAGIVDLQPPAVVPADITALADRVLIQETTARYAIAYDERRLDILASLFTADGRYTYQIGDTPPVGRSVPEGLIDWLGEIMQSQSDQRRHMLSSFVIDELTADRAVAVVYKTIYGIEEEAQLITTGLYRFTLVKQDGRWLIENALDALDRAF